MQALASAAAAARPEDPSAASILEILALDALTPSLRAAHHHVLTVAAQRHPAWLLRAHRYRDEVHLLLSTLLEAHSLKRFNASFAEHFYGLVRASSGDRPRHFAWELLLLQLPMYLRAKLEPLLIDDEWANGAADGPNAAAANAAGTRTTTTDANTATGTNTTGSSGTRSARLRASALERARVAARLLYRLVSTVAEGSNLVQLLLFMYGRSKYATLTQRLLGYSLRRALAIPGGAAQTSELPASAAPWQRVVHLLEAPLRHARHLLLLSVFSYRLLEWWHAPQHAPPPPPRLIPPPPPPPPTKNGLPSPWGVCGMCRMPPVEPTAAPSGYVYCSRCAHAAVRRDARCPVSGMPMQATDLRRLYETSLPPER